MVRVFPAAVLWGFGCALALLAPRAARAHADAAPASEAPSTFQLRMPELRGAPLLSGVDLSAPAAIPRLHPLRLSLDLGAGVLRLAVHGDHRPGLAPFLGTSTTSLGGLRLRF